jgi:hypothetical protein
MTISHWLNAGGGGGGGADPKHVSHKYVSFSKRRRGCRVLNLNNLD